MLLNCGVGEDSWQSLGLQRDQTVCPRGNQPWIFVGRTDAEAETPILWPPDLKNWFIGKGPDAGKGWRQKEKGMMEDEMVGWHHWLDGHEFEQAPWVGDGQGSLVCCSLWGCGVSDTTERQNWTDNRISSLKCFCCPSSFLPSSTQGAGTPSMSYHYLLLSCSFNTTKEVLGNRYQ